MADCHIVGGRVRSIWFFLCVSLFLLCQDTTDPTDNVNLTPFARWLSGYYCLKNVSEVCPRNYTLKASGWLNVSANDTQVFCQAGGCRDHTNAVLTCIHYVKPDYWFANKATVKDLKDTINIGCIQGFNGTSFYPSNGYKKTAVSIVTTFSALIFFALFYM